MDPLKIIIFAGVFLLLLLVGRLLSASSEVYAHQLPLPQPGGDRVPQAAGVDQSPAPQEQVLTGSEIGFPFSLPAVSQDDKGKFNRPIYLNYYFSKTDLVRGPADPNSFYDELFLVFQDPASQHTWETKYIVTTPSGLQEVMRKEHFVSIYLDDPVVIVGEWNLAAILRAVIDENMKTFGEAGESL